MIVTLVSFAFFFGLLINRIGLPPMVGFLAAGFAYNFAGLEAPEGLQTVADLGVTLLLFSIGLKLKLKDLAAAEVWGTSVAHIVASTLFFSCVIFIGQLCFNTELFQLSLPSILALGFGLSFSSTVYAVKVLEDKGDMGALYGKVAIGILVMQDIFAVVFLTVSEGKYPSAMAVLALLLLLPQVRKAIYKVVDYAGHGELLVVSGLFFALGAGYEFFYSVDLKGDLGALILGVVISNHPKAKALAKSLFSFKELMLVGFFLSVGMQGLPNLAVILTALGLVLLLPVKTWLYMFITTRFGLRARTSLFSSITLGNYSEFGLIVAALGVSQGFLSVDWLLVMAIAVSISFAVAAPFSARAEKTYHDNKNMWNVYQKDKLNPKDEILDTGNSTVLIIGMGRVGLGAYKVLNEERSGKVLGIELNEERAADLVQQGYNVKVADATDTDFWNMVRLSEPVEEMILLAMPNHHSNVFAAERIQASGLDCKVVAIAKHETEVEELLKLGIPSFNLYREAGEGLGREAIKEINLQHA
ncbi:MAG: cation:proton antiporter family protein [Alphaproteobacteria bacterium]|jgi:predicted Kef-type K+ transport protein